MTNATDELKPCPWCGGEASVKAMEYGDDYKVWGVFCESDLESEYGHGHFLDNFATEAEAIAAWNTRTPEQAIAATLGKQKAKAHPYGYELDTGTFDVSRCECGCLNDISATYCNDCGGEIEIDMNAEKEIYHIPRHLVFAEKHDDGSLEFGGKRYVAATLGSDTKLCYATDYTHGHCKYSVNRGWTEDTKFYIPTMRHGTLTAEQVRTSIESRFDFDVWVPNTRWQAIADELNAALCGGECEMEYATEGMKRGWWVCSECGEASDTIKACGGRVPPNFCANCGAKAVER